MEKKSKRRPIKIIALICVLLLLSIVSLSWFSGNRQDPIQANIASGKIKYQFNDTAQNIFFSSFDLEDDDYIEEGGDIEDGVYIPAQSVVIYAAGAPVSGAYSLEQNTSLRFIPVTTPTPCTDKVVWTTSDSSKITVSEYGKIRAVGKVGDSATITMTLKDRTPDNPRADIVKTVVVTVIKPAEPGNPENNFLPANTKIMREPLSLINYSNVNSKLRMQLKWQYRNAEFEEGTNPRKAYSGAALDALLAPISGQRVIEYNGESPIVAQFAADGGNALWNGITSDYKLILQDKNGVQWEVIGLALTDAEYASLVGEPDTFTFLPIMIDAAQRAFYYGPQTTAADYGSVVPAGLGSVDNPTAEQIAAATIPAIDQITVMESYTLFSNRKIFGVDIVFQARQADYFTLGAQNQKDKWFDVGTCTFHTNTHP